MFCLNANVDFLKSVAAVESGSNSNPIMEIAEKSIHPASTIYCPKQSSPCMILHLKETLTLNVKQQWDSAKV